MAPGFKFPPPPPPPPPKASNDAPNAYNSQKGGRGDRGRGRGGGAPGRGHGNYQSNSRGGHQQAGGGNQHGGHRGGQQRHGRRGPPSDGTRTGTYQQQHQNVNTASQTYADTNFTPTYSNAGVPNTSMNGLPSAPMDPGALIQAMAFMTTPAGMQSMAAFASHMVGGNATAPYGQPGQAQQSVSQNQSTLPQPESRKRKRGERVGSWQAQQQQQQRHVPAGKPPTQKPPRAKAKPAPAVPGFGFSLPTLPTPKPSVPAKATVSNSQDKKHVSLGLTQLNYDDESSGEEEVDVDEEAAFAAKWDGEGITFEHNGDLISLQTGAEVAAYIKDRKRNYPTQTRIAEKAQKAAEKRTNELEFLRRVRGTSKKEQTPEEPQASSRRQKEAKQQAASTEPSLDKLREKVKQSIPSKPPQTVDLGLGYGTDTDAESDDSSSTLSESSVVPSSESSEDLSSKSDSDEESDDDTPPETHSSRTPIAPVVPPPPPRLPDQEAADPAKAKAKVCPQWRATGKCKYTRCRYKHAEVEPKFIGLYERMVEAELQKADKLALEAIKYLGRNGFLG